MGDSLARLSQMLDGDNDVITNIERKSICILIQPRDSRIAVADLAAIRGRGGASTVVGDRPGVCVTRLGAIVASHVFGDSCGGD